MWIQRLLVQISVEVFLREDFPSLIFSSNHNDGFVYIAAGFTDGYDDGGLDHIAQEIAQARANGKVFPEYRDLGGFGVKVFKTNDDQTVTTGTSSSSSSEKTSRLVDHNAKPVLVNFHIDEEPMTWEEYLNRHGRLLGDSTEPVLPKFQQIDLEKKAIAYRASRPSSSSY